MADVFGAPPFSVLDARQGYWMERKKEWMSIGIKSEESREDIVVYNNSGFDPEKYDMTIPKKQVSVFDPVLCELMYRWFGIQEGNIFDPFSGGSVRGIVAENLGLSYSGIDLRQEQVDANKKNAKELKCSPTWICDDSRNTLKHFEKQSFDMAFTCPPYADLEVYSEDERDLSNMEYTEFIKAYSEIIKNVYSVLKNDRFFVIVVGEVRRKKGDYYNFVSDTIKSCIDAGFCYYNEIIYITPAGTLPFRAGRSMNATRKIGKTHQNVLVFYKGDMKNIKNNYGEIVKEDVQ